MPEGKGKIPNLYGIIAVISEVQPFMEEHKSLTEYLVITIFYNPPPRRIDTLFYNKSFLIS